jgi:hypothetical protein
LNTVQGEKIRKQVTQGISSIGNQRRRDTECKLTSIQYQVHDDSNQRDAIGSIGIRKQVLAYRDGSRMFGSAVS